MSWWRRLDRDDQVVLPLVAGLAIVAIITIVAGSGSDSSRGSSGSGDSSSMVGSETVGEWQQRLKSELVSHGEKAESVNCQAETPTRLLCTVGHTDGSISERRLWVDDPVDGAFRSQLILQSR
jgi:hypothetical protein